ncbi:MAG: PP2C family protein-serine/threonine phosphatase [Gemmataceae bacterium]
MGGKRRTSSVLVPLESARMNNLEKLHFIVEMMKEMSMQTDPQVMRSAYTQRVHKLIPVDGSLSLSRRDLHQPQYRITRYTGWNKDINPWTEKDRLPLMEGGILSELIYSDHPRLIDDLRIEKDDPALPYLEGMKSLAAVPLYDQGEGLNMVVLLRKEESAFDAESFPQLVWMSNLYGRATKSLVLSEELRAAYEEMEYEMKVVADIQRSLLPSPPPIIPNLSVAAHYQTSRQAGGDYYDFFPLANQRWGMIIADVSGHGTPAAVVMAVTHALAHTYCSEKDRPGAMLSYLNRELFRLHTSRYDSFVTAFHAIYDPEKRQLIYASAGHNPPRLKRCEDGSLELLDKVGGLPLGVLPEQNYPEAVHQLVTGDQLVLYTDGITEAMNLSGQMFGLARLDQVLENCAVGAPHLLRSILDAIDDFTEGRTAEDDRTVLILKVS